jgi:hypothetical protein
MNCGKELQSPHQNFCKHCGAKIQKSFVSSQPMNSRMIKIRKSGPPGSFSKICFAFGVISFILSILLYFIGAYMNLNTYYREITFYILLSIMVVSRVTGFAFGVIAIGIRKTVKRVEPKNNLEIAGNAFGIIGIIFNVFGLLMLFPYMVITFF